jgi:type I restriction enzyme S subunit
VNANAIPSSWRNTTLGEVAASVPNAIVDGPFGSNLKTSDYVEEGVPVLQGKNITNDSFRWFDVRFISDRKAAELKRSSVRVGDILIIKIGSIGYSAIVKDLNGFEFAIIPANLAKLTPDASKVDLVYLHKWLTSVDAKRYLNSVASKTAQPALSLGKIKSLPLPLPPLAEQRRIAEVLDRAEALRAKRRAALAQLDSLTQSLFLDLFGDPATNPKGWPSKPVGSLASKFSDGPFGSNLKSEHYTETGVRVIRLQNIGVGEFVDDDAAYISEHHFAKLKKHECRPGDVLIGTMGDPNLRACIQPEWLTIALNKADCVLLRPDESVANAMFICALLNQPATERMAQDLIHGQTRARISMGRLRGLEVPVPPIPLQREFARRVTAVEALKTAQRASLAELDALFATLQHRAFRGEL